MIYIYDILLNFSDEKRLLEFYEWSKKDGLEHIKKIPLFKINTIDMDNICNGKIKVDKSFLDKIYNSTMVYRNKKYIRYGALFCDLNRVVAVEFYKDGTPICKSTLLLDEEEEIIDECIDLRDYDLNYKVLEKYDVDFFSTREELFRKNYLIHEIVSLFKDKYFDKFNYLYEEIFGRDEKTTSDRYTVLLEDINNNYNDKYNKLYDIVRLSYSKKK